MRTKALILTALLGVASITAALAAGEVYSVNAVGYVNVPIKPGFSMIANPLIAATNTVSALFGGMTGGVPSGMTIYKFNPITGYSGNAYRFGNWSSPNDTLLPGEGVFVLNPAATTNTVTFVGEVPQGSLTNAIPLGFSIRSSIVPQKGKLTTDLGYPVVNNTTIYRFNVTGQPAGYTGYSYRFGNWSVEPEPEVAEGFFISAPAATEWKRTFTVN